MVKLLLYYAVATVLLAGVDWYRRKKQMGKVVNINHNVSTGLAIISAVIIGVIVIHTQSALWKYLAVPVMYATGCIGVRLLIYDPILNLFIDGKLSNVSTTTDSYKDTHTNHLPFWWQRAIGAGTVVVSLLIYKLFL